MGTNDDTRRGFVGKMQRMPCSKIIIAVAVSMIATYPASWDHQLNKNGKFGQGVTTKLGVTAALAPRALARPTALQALIYLVGLKRERHAISNAFLTHQCHPFSHFTTAIFTAKRRRNVLTSIRASSSAQTSPSTIQPISGSNSTNIITKKTRHIADNIEFPGPITQTERLLRAATFWSTAVPIIISYYGKFAELKLRQKMLNECISDEECHVEWSNLHVIGATKLADTITSLNGFYVKTAQIIASRQDLFPVQYTEALQGFTDDLDPMPSSLARAVISAELLHKDEAFEDVFTEFDQVPLGSASIAQVHRAVLSPKYGGPREVAIKVQRPAIEPKLMGDIANLKALSKPLQDVKALPLDYYTVFCELEAQLQDEFDFVAEASAMDRIYNSLSKSYDGRRSAAIPLVIPRPIEGLVSRRVLVMDYLNGVPLSRAREEMIRKGIDPESPEAKLFGRKLLGALTHVFGRSILETGFFHADPHPGNIFVLDDGSIGLIDFGQVKQISGRSRETLAKVMVALDERKSDTNPSDLEAIGNLALELGVEIKKGARKEAAAAIGMWLFDGTVEELPGGYDKGELSPNSPVKELKSFPQDLVLVGRSTILIKGLSSRLGIPWSLSKEWAPIARMVLEKKPSASLHRVQFGDVMYTFLQWGKGKIGRAMRRLPSPVRSKMAAIMVNVEERRSRRRLNKKID